MQKNGDTVYDLIVGNKAAFLSKILSLSTPS